MDWRMPCWVEAAKARILTRSHVPYLDASRARVLLLAATLALTIALSGGFSPALPASADSSPLDDPAKGNDGGRRARSKSTLEADQLPPTPVPGDSPSNLLAPDLLTVPPTRLQLIFIAESGELLLRFDNTIYNGGTGPLEVVGQIDPATGETHVHQRLYIRTGARAERRVGRFLYHPHHFHWHMEDFALYEVLPVSLSGQPARSVASNKKVGYCLMDLRFQGGGGGAFRQPRPEYEGCNKEIQGISVGWGDLYEYFRPDQWVDVTDLPDGLYALRSTVDPDDLLLEGDETNNSATVFFSLHDRVLRVLSGLRLPY